jgi:hypothetical protein
MKKFSNFSGNVIPKSEIQSIKGGYVEDIVLGLFENCMFLQAAYNNASNSTDREAFFKKAKSLNCPGTNGNE